MTVYIESHKPVASVTAKERLVIKAFPTSDANAPIPKYWRQRAALARKHKRIKGWNIRLCRRPLAQCPDSRRNHAGTYLRRAPQLNSLDKIKARAQAGANRDGRAVAVLNFNRSGSPLYAIREIDPGIEQCREFVCLIQPQEESAQ